jgi:hypothetical protein
MCFMYGRMDDSGHCSGSYICIAECDVPGLMRSADNALGCKN